MIVRLFKVQMYSYSFILWNSMIGFDAYLVLTGMNLFYSHTHGTSFLSRAARQSALSLTRLRLVNAAVTARMFGAA